MIPIVQINTDQQDRTLITLLADALRGHVHPRTLRTVVEELCACAIRWDEITGEPLAAPTCPAESDYPQEAGLEDSRNVCGQPVKPRYFALWPDAPPRVVLSSMQSLALRGEIAVVGAAAGVIEHILTMEVDNGQYN